MKLRVITSEGCHKCKFYLKVLSKANFEFETLSGDDEKNDDKLDAWRITEYPVVQIISNGEVRFQFPPGQIRPQLLRYKLQELSKGGAK